MSTEFVYTTTTVDERREYRERLDRMVAAIAASPAEAWASSSWGEMAEEAVAALSSIDAAVAEKFGEVKP